MSIVRKLSVATVGLASIALSMGQAHAVSIIGSPTGLSNPASTITFSERTFPEDTPLTNQYSDLGVTFSPQLYYSSFDPVPSPNINVPAVNNFTGGPVSFPISIRFTQAQTGAAFAAVTQGGTSTFTALLNGVVVETFNAVVTNSSNNFYGFSDITFNEINFAPGGTLTVIDNIQLSTASAAVPFEVSPGLGSIGLAACGAIAYFKDNKKRKISAKVFSKG